MAMSERFWQYVTSALLAGLLAVITISWNASRHEHEALGQMTEWHNKAQDARLERLETRQEDVRSRLSKMENQYLFEALAAMGELRKRLEALETRVYRSPRYRDPVDNGPQ